MSDLYIRNEGDPNWTPNQLEIEDEVQLLISQIEMLLFTDQGEVLGAYEMGCNIYELLWSLSVSAGVIKSSIYNQIMYYCPLATKYKVTIDVKLFKGTDKDIGVVDVLVDGSRQTGYVIS